MGTYASKTKVPVDRSRAEIESVLRRYNGTGFFYGYEDDPPRVMIGFKMAKRAVQFELKTPRRNEYRYEQAWQQAMRQRWRALLLVIKAKLEAVECGITTFEEEFLAHLVLPDGSTVGARLIPQIEAVTSGKKPVRLLPEGRLGADQQDPS